MVANTIAVESRVVPVDAKHKHIQGDVMKNVKEYDKTIKIGNTTINFVAPPPMTEEQTEKIQDEINAAAWAIIDEMIDKGLTDDPIFTGQSKPLPRAKI